MTFGKYLTHGLFVRLQSTKEGSQTDIRHQINMSNIRRPLSIMPRNKTVEFRGIPSASLFENSRTSYIINIGKV